MIDAVETPERKDEEASKAGVVWHNQESHRSQYGFVEGGTRWMSEALPNATFIGFSGTPLTAGDKVTRHVIGDHADVYDICRAVAYGATDDEPRRPCVRMLDKSGD